MPRIFISVFIAVLFTLLLVACANGETKLQERLTFWRGILAKEVPIGTSAENIKKWGLTHKVKLDYLEHQHWLYANVEVVPIDGIPFPCSEWNIILKISIDDTGHSSKNDVSPVGSCL